MRPGPRHPRWTYEQTRAAMRLREAGLSYSAVAIVLELYHDVPRMEGEHVRRRLRLRGAPPKPHGRPYGPDTRPR